MALTNHFGGAISTADAESRYHVSKRYIAFLARKGLIVAKKLGRDWLIDENSLSHYLTTPQKRGPKKKKMENATM